MSVSLSLGMSGITTAMTKKRKKHSKKKRGAVYEEFAVEGNSIQRSTARKQFQPGAGEEDPPASKTGTEE